VKLIAIAMQISRWTPSQGRLVEDAKSRFEYFANAICEYFFDRVQPLGFLRKRRTAKKGNVLSIVTMSRELGSCVRIELGSTTLEKRTIFFTTPKLKLLKITNQILLIFLYFFILFFSQMYINSIKIIFIVKIVL